MLYEYRTEPMLERLHNGDIDVGILALPVHDDMLVSRELYAEPFVLAVPDSHRLARRAQVRTSDLDEETLLLLEDGHCLRDQALAVCARSGIREKQDFRATSIETLRQMVAAGVGITLLPMLASRGAYGSARGMTHACHSPNPCPAAASARSGAKSSARAAAIGAVCDQIARHSGLT